MPQRVQTLRSSTKNQRPAGGSREPGELYVNFPDRQIGFVNASKNPEDLIAVRFFSAATNYAAGDFVIQAGRGYKAKTAIVAGPFNEADWDTLSIEGESEPPIAPGDIDEYWRGDKTWALLDKAAVGLGNVDNTSDASKPISGATQTALNLKANIASPTLTGDPKAPTPPPGDNDTSIATTAFVAASFAPIMSPTFGGDPQSQTPPPGDNDLSIATTAFVQGEIAGKAPINSPTFTGDPKAPTPPLGDADTSIATTKFVKDQGYLTDAPSDGLVYGRKNALWSTVIGGAHTDDNPPLAPLQDGQLWWKSSTGAMFIWYDDGNSQQWVQVAGTLESPYPLVRATAQARNRVVNGGMQISQENGNTGSAASDYYAADQWTTFASGIVYSGARSPSAIGYRVLVSVTTGKPSLAASDTLGMQQRIEGVRIADFFWGSADAKALVAAFDVYADVAGTYTFSLRNSAQDRCFLAPFTVPAATWTRCVIAIPGDTSGTWLTDTGIGLRVAFTFAAGSTYHGVEGWQAGGKLMLASATNGAATSAKSFYVKNVGLYLDPDRTGLPPQWQMPDEAEELRACQRYYYRTPSTITQIVSGIAQAAGQFSYASMKLPAQMRAAPSIAFVSPSVANATGPTVGTAAGGDAWQAYVTSAASGSFYGSFGYTANARM